VLYQLSYSRVAAIVQLAAYVSIITLTDVLPDGGEGNRTPDLLNAIQALSQLSYAPGLDRSQLFK
jgi:hypothetical protein